MDNTSEYKFVNRFEELKLLKTYSGLGGLLIVLGRRRIGKTSLLIKWLDSIKGAYTQAIEGALELQLRQVVEDLSTKIQFPSKPNSWLELLRLLNVDGKKKVICIDEFQYLVKTDPSLPSVLQKWLDHENKNKTLIVLSGSSTKVMTQASLDSNSPLYGRARQIITLRPLEYQYFADYCGLKKEDSGTFELFSLVGGIPKYWEYLKIIKELRSLKKMSVSNVVDDLFFSPSPFMEGEVNRLLSDEKIEGITPLSVLEAIGRGVSRPSEIAGRLGVPQVQLSKVFEQLLTSSIIAKEIPYGTSPKKAKNVNYKILDPSILSWFSLASSHRSRWREYEEEAKKQILSTHIGGVYENFLRTAMNASRYWDANCEIDMIFEKNKSLYIAEVKWSKLSKANSDTVYKQLLQKVQGLKAGDIKNFKSVFIEIYDRTFLKTSKPLISQRTNLY